MPINPNELKPGQLFTINNDEVPFVSFVEVLAVHSDRIELKAYLTHGEINPSFNWYRPSGRWNACQLVDHSVLLHWMGRLRGRESSEMCRSRFAQTQFFRLPR